ncbi:unnamed protein product [Calypogeia fissa]
MAFTSKAIILLLFSSLAWWQASALDGSTEIVQGLKNITTMTKALTTEVNRISKSNVGVYGRRVVDGIENITKAFVRANSSLNTVSGRLSDRDEFPVLGAFIKVSQAHRNLTRSLVAEKTFIILITNGYAESIESALFRLREVVVTKTESYGPHLLRFLIRGEYLRIFLRKLDESLSFALFRFAQLGG